MQRCGGLVRCVRVSSGDDRTAVGYHKVEHARLVAEAVLDCHVADGGDGGGHEGREGGGGELEHRVVQLGRREKDGSD